MKELQEITGEGFKDFLPSTMVGVSLKGFLQPK